MRENLENKDEIKAMLGINREERFQKSKDNSAYYFDYLRMVLNKTHIMTVKQMLRILSVKFNFIEPKCLEIILDAQKENYVLVSRDGFIMTRGYYLAKTGDNFFDDLEINNYQNKINFDFKKYTLEDQGLLDCMTVVAGMMPVSEEFVMANKPWDFIFTTPFFLLKSKKDRERFSPCLYQICYIPHATASATCRMLNTVEVESEDGRQSVKRIAVVENPEDAILVPHIGFTNIVQIKKDTFEIVEHRNNPWGDKKDK